MAVWPTLAELKAELGTTVTSRDEVLQRALDASIEQVKIDVQGSMPGTAWDDVGDPEADPPIPPDVPNSSLSSAALILAVMVAKAPAAPYGIVSAFDTGAVRVAADHPTYRRLLKGRRRRFGIG